jgi:signal transduction histidine kinase
VSRAVIGAALATAAGAIPALLGLGDDVIPTGALSGAGWPAFGVAAAILLDRDPRSRLGRVLAVLAVLPAVVLVVSVLAAGDRRSVWSYVEDSWERLGIVPIVVALGVIAWGVGIAFDRMARRRLVWLVVWSAALVAGVLAPSFTAGPRVMAVVTTLGLWGTAGLVYRLATTHELRPIDEPLVDAAAAIATLLVGAGVGTLVRIGSQRAGIPGPDVSGAFAAVVVVALTLSAGRWLRRSFLQRRYGPGALSAVDVEQITADLHSQTDARELLVKAAAMVATASGHRQVGLVLGPDAPELPVHWVLYPLVVGGDRVGTVFLEPRHPEGPEPRQERVVRQLLPTVSLVAKAVSLAVEADHARQDVARERDAERARILGDLHDGLGPMLVGMGMRVRAELRQRPTPLLEALASELADCRGDLRRVVSGLTPSMLHDGDLTTALQRLVGSFDGQGPSITLDSGLQESLAPEIAVAVYRSVAEGVTNALRHARAQQISVDVHTTLHGTVLVDVSDDGVGGPVAPGVGLSSLRRRAQELGGSLHVAPGHTSGIRLHLELPTRKPAA